MTVEAKLRVTPQLEAAVAGLRGLLGQVRALEGGIQQADSKNTFRGTQAGIDGVSSRLRQVHAQLLAFFGLQAGAQAVAGLARMSDAYQGLNARLRIATSGQQEYSAALGQTRALAERYNQPLAETSQLYTRLLSALKPLGGGLRETGAATEAMLASLKITGAGAAESASAILQFSQALGSGVLRGEEFNAINEAAPRLLTALAAGLGRSRGELKAMAEQGQLTTAAVVKALQSQLPALRAEAGQVPATIGGAVQQARDALMQFIGAAAETNGVAAVTVQALKLLAENIGGVVTAISVLAVGWAALKLSAWVGVVTGTTAAFGALAAVLGGPLGIAAALTAVALGWAAVSLAKDKAQNRTKERVLDELRGAQAELDDLESKKQAKTATGPDFVRLPAVRAELAKLRAELDGLAETSREIARDDFRKAEREGPTGTLRDATSATKFREKFKLPSDISREAALERKRAQEEFDAEIADAKAAGDDKRVRTLTRENAQRMAESRRKEQDELRSIAQRDAVTRLAQAKQLYDKDFELLADAAQRERDLLQKQFDDGITDLQSYLAEKARLQDAAANFEIDRLTAAQVAEEEALRKNRTVFAGAKDANAREGALSAIADGERRVLELEVEIAKQERDRVANARLLTQEAARLSAELREQQKAVETALKQSAGTETDADIARRVQDQFAQQLAREFQLGGDGSATQSLVDATVLQQAFAARQRRLGNARTELNQAEEAVRIQQDAGAITAEEAEQRILAARRAQIPVLQQIATELAKLGRSPEEQAQAAAADLELRRLGDLRNTAQKTLDATARSGLGQLFTDIVTGSKTAGDALRSMLGNFAQQMLNLTAQRLGNRLFESFGLNKVVDGAASFITSIFGFHSGGLVSAGGASFTRSMDLSPLALALAPRYHTGGIVGMRPNERIGVLEDGEEVLTADDPRHRRNYRGGGVQVTSSVTVNGASGDASAQKNAGADLSRLVESAVDQWALKQSRPGGILARG